MEALVQHTLLLVDDEPLILDVCGAVLRNSGYHVLCSRSGRTGLELFQEHKDKIDIVVSDILMPDMRGTDMASLMVSEKAGLRILFMSGYGVGTVPEVLEPDLRLLDKPFTSEQLLEAVRSALGARGSSAPEVDP